MKTITTKILGLFLVLFITLSISSCNNDDGSIKLEQGNIELTIDNLTSKSVNDFFYNRNTSNKTHELSNGKNSNNLLELKDYQSIKFSKNNFNCSLPILLKNEKKQIYIDYVNAKWEIISNNSIRIYNLTNNLDDIILEKVELKRQGKNIENEYLDIRFEYKSTVLNDTVTIWGTTENN